MECVLLGYGLRELYTEFIRNLHYHHRKQFCWYTHEFPGSYLRSQYILCTRSSVNVYAYCTYGHCTYCTRSTPYEHCTVLRTFQRGWYVSDCAMGRNPETHVYTGEFVFDDDNGNTVENNFAGVHKSFQVL
jgi:hypothetical protein